MSNWAMVNNDSNIVSYIIVANITPATRGCYAVNVDGLPQVQVGWSYDPSTNTFSAPV